MSKKLLWTKGFKMKGVFSMKRKKLLIAMLCIALMASTFSLTAYANLNGNLDINTSFNLSAPGDTLKMTQAEYMEAAKNAMNQSENDDQKIQTICEIFLTLAKASVRSPQGYDCTQLISPDSLSKSTIQYRLTDFQYQSALNKALGWEILWDDLVFSDFKVNRSNSTATASVVESYSYYVTDGFDSNSFRRKMYTFELLLGSNGWKITNVTTDDPWELDDKFIYTPINVKDAVDAQLNEINIISSSKPLMDEAKDIKEGIQVLPATTMYTWTYDTADAVTYAENHYDDTSNSVFGFNSGNDCQNFASQCVWAGLGGSGTDKKARPAVSTTLVGSSAFNVWCAGQSTTYYPSSTYWLNWTWDNVRGFSKLMVASTSSAEGPYGNAYYSSGIQNAEVGNVLTVDWAGAPAQDTLDHAMFVTSVTGTYGSRDKTNVKIAAHTSPTNSAYQTVSSYTSEPIASFGRAVIWRGYYSIQQQ